MKELYFPLLICIEIKESIKRFEKKNHARSCFCNFLCVRTQFNLFFFLIYRYGPSIEIVNDKSETNNQFSVQLEKLKRNKISINLENQNIQRKLLICVPKPTTNPNESRILRDTLSDTNSSNISTRHQMPVLSISSINNQMREKYNSQMESCSSLKNNKKQEVYIYASQLYSKLFSEPKRL